MNEPQAFAQTDAEWLASINRARDWFQGPLGSLMLAEERRLLCDELTRYFGGYLVHYGPHAELPPSTGQIQRGVRLGPPLPGVDIACEEGAWPLSEHAADVVLLQHGLDFCLSPHRLLREAARTVRPGGHLLLIGINPWSLWGIRHYFAGDALRQARCIPPSRACDWLNLLGFALE
ncbi:TPA: methyltransferase domain-containing protein, partial [Pseudomonas aeruginosa]|nr:methyltransferase domain-containing protein [Pseudomonas aeruginosa]